MDNELLPGGRAENSLPSLLHLGVHHVLERREQSKGIVWIVMRFRCESYGPAFAWNPITYLQCTRLVARRAQRVSKVTRENRPAKVIWTPKHVLGRRITASPEYASSSSRMNNFFRAARAGCLYLGHVGRSLGRESDGERRNRRVHAPAQFLWVSRARTMWLISGFQVVYSFVHFRGKYHG